ncbi:MAG: hypothetical protein WDW38_003579 [Sanguina aurantia]
MLQLADLGGGKDMHSYEDNTRRKRHVQIPQRFKNGGGLQKDRFSTMQLHRITRMAHSTTFHSTITSHSST